MSNMQKAVKLYKNTDTPIDKICKQCDISKSTFYRNYNGVKRGHLNQGRKYNFNLQKFLNMNKELAYWLGFIAADGSIVKSSLTIQLQASDISFLKRFNNYFENEKEVKLLKNSNGSLTCRTSIHSKQLVTILKKYDLTQNKTSNLVMPLQALGEYTSHWVRGYFDGDGTVSIRKNGQLYFSVVSGSYKLIEQLREFFQLDNKIIDYDTWYKLTVTGNIKAKRLLERIYKNSNKHIRMERKYSNYAKIGHPNESAGNSL